MVPNVTTMNMLKRWKHQTINNDVQLSANHKVKVTDTEQMFAIAMTGTFETMAYGLRRTGYKYITAATSEPTNVTAKIA